MISYTEDKIYTYMFMPTFIWTLWAFKCGAPIHKSGRYNFMAPDNVEEYGNDLPKLAIGLFLRGTNSEAQLPTPWRFEPAKRPDDRVDYYLSLLQCEHLQSAVFLFLVRTLDTRFY